QVDAVLLADGDPLAVRVEGDARRGRRVVNQSGGHVKQHGEVQPVQVGFGLAVDGLQGLDQPRQAEERVPVAGRGPGLLGVLAGAFARHFSAMTDNSRSARGFRCRGSSGSRSITWRTVFRTPLPRNGGRPVSTSYKMAPSE